MIFVGGFIHRMQVKWRGRSDGKLDRPASDEQGPTGYEASLISVGNSLLHKLMSRRISARKNRLEAGIADAKRRQVNIAARLQTQGDRYIGKGRAPITPLPRPVYWVIIAVIIFAEFPFNITVFRTVGEAEWITWVMGGGIALAIPVAAHLIGVHARQAKTEWWVTAITTALMAGVIISLLFALNFIRVEYLAELPADERFIRDPKTLEYAYFGINLLLFFVGALGAFFTHDRDPEIEDLEETVDRLQETADRLHAREQQLRNDLEALRESIDAKAARIRGTMTELVYLYKHRNTNARGTRAPEHFRRDPEFQEIRWNSE